MNVKLSLSIFDKQIVPILLYGSNIWSLPQTHTLLYILNQSNNGKTREIAEKFLDNLGAKKIPIHYAKRVGKTNNQQSKKILVKLKQYDDVELLLRQNSDSLQTFHPSVPHDIEKVHSDFCKKALSVSKYSSTSAVMSEVGRFPILHNAYSFAVKYWFRLNNGTSNTLLNNAFIVNKDEKLDWYQGIQYILCQNGFRNVWLDFRSVNNDSFDKVFKKRLNDQSIQNVFGKISNSDRLPVLNDIGLSYSFKGYLSRVRNPDIRTIFTKLRIDMNELNACRFRLKKILSPKCNVCLNEDEDVKHVLFKCSKYELLRKCFYDNISKKPPYFISLSNSNKMNIVLDMKYKEFDGYVCKFVSDVYTSRDTVTV